FNSAKVRFIQQSHDVLKNLLNGWFMHIAIHAKNLKELADKKGQFIAIYRGFLLSLKDK
ncbi:TPA: hypothetical protein L1L66_005301, partial [Escherichia coli]|nr:hypothetical protein [Escherichia coli]